MELPRAVRTGRQEEMSNSAVVAQKNPFGLRIGWQVKITTDDIDDISSVEDIATAVSWAACMDCGCQ